MKRYRLAASLLLVVLMFVGGGSLWLWQAKQQYARNRALITALVNNDMSQALTLVNMGADPNTCFNPPPTPSAMELLQHFLHHSPPPLDDSPTAFLLACGAGWDGLQNVDGMQQFHTVDVQLAEAMLLHGAIVHPQTTVVETALYGAVSHNQTRVAELLLTHGADANERYASAETPLKAAVERRCGDMVRLLLAHHADINAKDEMENTALFHAVYAIEDKEMVQILLAHHADPNVPGRYGQTVLTHLWEARRPEIVALLRPEP